MSDADLIYNALLRAERRIEGSAESAVRQKLPDLHRAAMTGALIAVQMIREEIGNALARKGA